MHNGQISEFHKIKRRLLHALPEPLFLLPQGHTDSEFTFALFLSHLRDPLMKEDYSCSELKEAMLRTIEDLNRWSKEAGIEQVRCDLPAEFDELLRNGWPEHRVHTLHFVSHRRGSESGAPLLTVLFYGHIVLRALARVISHGQGRSPPKDCGCGERATHL